MMDEEKMKNDERLDEVFEMYFNAHKLKNLPRSGWIKWGLDENVRHESVAEHVYGCLMLAISIFANLDVGKLDKEKVLSMLILHETEEIFIGDITPYDDEKFTKKEKGYEAVQKFFKNAKNSAEYLAIIAEFEERKTKEALFAYEIDKFEANIQAKIYEEKFHREKVGDKVLKNEQILSYQAKGLSKVHEFFIESDVGNYDEMFKKLAEKLKNLEIPKE